MRSGLARNFLQAFVSDRIRAWDWIKQRDNLPPGSPVSRFCWRRLRHRFPMPWQQQKALASPGWKSVRPRAPSSFKSLTTTTPPSHPLPLKRQCSLSTVLSALPMRDRSACHRLLSLPFPLQAVLPYCRHSSINRRARFSSGPPRNLAPLLSLPDRC